MLRDLVLKNRSYRRFYQEFDIKLETLRELVDLARNSASARNVQPLRYILSADRRRNSLIFPRLMWAAYLKDWNGPEEGERPSAYIVILLDTDISRSVVCDQGIAAQSILLGATEKGLGGCMIANIDKEGLRRDLHIPARYEIALVLALGKPKEVVVIDVLESSAGIKYWRDADGVHHVPKRRLDDIIVGRGTAGCCAASVRDVMLPVYNAGSGILKPGSPHLEG